MEFKYETRVNAWLRNLTKGDCDEGSFLSFSISSRLSFLDHEFENNMLTVVIILLH
jgi:hypothetical protein